MKEALAASPSRDRVEVLTFDLSDELQWQEWKQHRHLLGFTMSPVLVRDGVAVACGVMAISAALELGI